MFPFLPLFTIAQTPPTPQEIVRPQEVRPLPGQLDNIPVFNSNSPEVVIEEGILLSTFPPNNKTNQNAHLNYPLQGRFDIFAHHISKATEENGLRTLYIGILLHNPTDKTVTIDVLPAASYLSQPDAPFIELPSKLPNPTGSVYAGPGSRAMSDILRGMRQETIPNQLVIPPRESRMLLNLPIPISTLEPPINGRSTYIRLNSDGEVYAASLAMFAPIDNIGNERQPTLEEWERVLENGQLATPRDRVPTPPDSTDGSFIYGRVAGVAKGSQWQAELIDNPNNRTLSIPAQGK
ncbi:MAG: DUF3370 domain-containing protein, partial [Chroococcales cyanobacterium]